MPNGDPGPLLLDPSLLMSPLLIDWLQTEREERRQPAIAVSASFRASLRSGTTRLFSPFLPEDEQGAYPERVETLTRLLANVTAVAYGDAALDDNEARRVLNDLLNSGDPDAPIFADEWAFLQSHSWLASRLRTPLDAFHRAGAAMVTYGKRVKDQIVDTVVPAGAAPNVLTPGFVAKVGAKWVIMGGAALGSGAVAGIIGGPIAGAGAGFAGGQGSRVLVRAANGH